MRIGLGLPHYGSLATVDALVEVSRAAEAMGYDSLWTGDRLFVPVRPSNPYPNAGGVIPPQFATFLDPLAALTFAAAHTERVRLGMSTLNVLWYPPVVLARTLTTLDILSRGRVDAGFGIGWMRDEYTAVNVPWERRGARLDETLDLLEKIWTSELVHHDGPLFTVVPTPIEPKPVQRPRPPILLPGFTRQAMRRVARRADGWLAVGAPPSVLGYHWSTIRREAEDAGRDPAEIRFIVRMNPHLADEKAEAEKVPSKGTMDQVIAYARSLVEVGADEVFIDLGQTARSAAEVLDRAGAFYDGVRAG
jgi:probable F420-dependent oxidoreductase